MRSIDRNLLFRATGPDATGALPPLALAGRRADHCCPPASNCSCPASAKDQRLTDTLLALRETPDLRFPSLGATRAGGCYVADKGFEGGNWRQHWCSD